MKLDFSEVKESTTVQEGTHTLTIKSCIEKTSQNGNNMLVLDLTDEEGNFMRDRVCTTGPAAFRAQQLFNAIGIDKDEAASMNAADLIGMSFTAETEIEAYEGKEYAKVKKFIR